MTTSPTPAGFAEEVSLVVVVVELSVTTGVGDAEELSWLEVSSAHGVVAGTGLQQITRAVEGPESKGVRIQAPYICKSPGCFRYARGVLIVIGSVEARPDTIDRILELGLAHVRRSREEPGCLLHSIHRDVENELRVVFIERWTDATALEAHFHVPASGEFVREAATLSHRPPEISIFEAEVASIPEPAPDTRGI